MEYIQNDFSKELSDLLSKHNKTFQSDKNGLYAVDEKWGTTVLIGRATVASEDTRDKLVLISNTW